MNKKNPDSFNTYSELKIGSSHVHFYDIQKLKTHGFQIDSLPFSLKILLENLLRFEDGKSVTAAHIQKLASWDAARVAETEIAFTPARVILQDFTGVPAICDLGAMRDAMQAMGGDAGKINPLLPAELVIDHSVQVDSFGSEKSLAINAAKEFSRNTERYAFLRWGQTAFNNFKVVPPDTGIVHQVNLEYLARVVFKSTQNGEPLAYPDSVVGTDSHTTMVNGLGVLGWGVGGIEAEAAMLGQPIPLLIPAVVGCELTGKMPEGTTATDLVLTLTQILRQKGVVGKFVEFFGAGLQNLSLADRATISNMSPEFGSTCAIFPIDQETLNYLKLTGRSRETLALVETYSKAMGLFHTANSRRANYAETVSLDLASVVPCLAGPARPQDRIKLPEAKEAFAKALPQILQNKKSAGVVKTILGDQSFELKHGSVVIAAITSCTNTSNPAVLIAAGLLAKKAVDLGLAVKPWVKTSLAPGSQVVTEYLKHSGLLPYLEKLKFHVVGYGCTTCIGNSGPLALPIATAIQESNLVAAAVLSGNRNFEGRINPHVRANYLASPPLVVAYALAGHMDWDPYHEPLGKSKAGTPVFLKDIWPTGKEIQQILQNSVHAKMFAEKYAEVFMGSPEWQAIKIPQGNQYAWQPESTYIREPPFFLGMQAKPGKLADIKNARVLAWLGDSVTTDHISPAGSIAKNSPAGGYLIAHGIAPEDFNSYGARRGNHEVMMRGTFANIRLKNLLLSGVEGGMTKHFPDGEQLSIYAAAMKYQKAKVPLIILAGKEYGSGSSRDWAAKGPRMLGITAVLAESFERIHRSNLIGMGILPLEFMAGQSAQTLGLNGTETYNITGIMEQLAPGKKLQISTSTGSNFEATTRIDTPVELEYYQHGGILQYVLRQLL